jgi:hypothetical protein
MTVSGDPCVLLPVSCHGTGRLWDDGDERTMGVMPTSPVPFQADSAPARTEAAEAGSAEVAPHHDAASVRRGYDTVREIKSPSSRVTIAFPFSQIKTQEASAELAELAALLVELVAALQEACPDAPLAALAERAEALRARTA